MNKVKLYLVWANGYKSVQFLLDFKKLWIKSLSEKNLQFWHSVVQPDSKVQRATLTIIVNKHEWLLEILHENVNKNQRNKYIFNGAGFRPVITNQKTLSFLF